MTPEAWLQSQSIPISWQIYSACGEIFLSADAKCHSLSLSFGSCPCQCSTLLPPSTFSPILPIHPCSSADSRSFLLCFQLSRRLIHLCASRPSLSESVRSPPLYSPQANSLLPLILWINSSSIFFYKRPHLITTDFCPIYCCNLLIVQQLPSLGRFPDEVYHGVVCQACQPNYATLTYPFPMAVQY